MRAKGDTKMGDFEARVQRAREANLALYLDNPTPQSARLMVSLEETILWLRERREREAAAAQVMAELAQAQGSDAP